MICAEMNENNPPSINIKVRIRNYLMGCIGKIDFIREYLKYIRLVLYPLVTEGRHNIRKYLKQSYDIRG